MEDLNEVEIILLKLSSLESRKKKSTVNENKEFGVIAGMDKYFAMMDYSSKIDSFYQRHSKILKNRIDKDSYTFYSSYMSNLERHDLIERSDKASSIWGLIPTYTVTPIGELFLRYIEVPEG